MNLFDIKKYFGRRGNEQDSTEIDEEMKRESSLNIRGVQPGTTSFNRNLVIGLAGLFAFIFLFSMIYGMSTSAPDKQKEEAAIKDKKVAAVPQTNSQLDKLPSSYGGKNQNTGTPSTLNGANSMSTPPISDGYTPPRQSYQSVNYSSPPIPLRPPAVPGQMHDLSAPTMPVTGIPTVQSPVNKEQQELEEARKSPIRFNVK